MLPYALLLMWLPQTCHYTFLLLKVGVKREQDQETWFCIVTPRMVASVEILCSSEPTKSKFFCVSVTKNDTVLTDCGCVPASPSCFGRKYLCCICKSIFFLIQASLVQTPAYERKISWFWSQVFSDGSTNKHYRILCWKPVGNLQYAQKASAVQDVHGAEDHGKKSMIMSSLVCVWILYRKFFRVFWLCYSLCFLGFFGCREPYLLPNEDILVLYILEKGGLSRKQSVTSISRGI